MDYFYGTSPSPEYEHYAWIVDAATLVQGFLWALNYGEASYRSVKDRTYGMAIFPLCCNYAWELVYTLIYSSQNKYERIIMTTWLILNSVMMGCAIKFAPNEWMHAPLVQRNIPFIFLAGVAAFVIAQLALAATVGPGLAMNWVAALCYLLLTIGSLCQLMTRGSSRGVSYTMWLSRFIGTYVGVICVYFRYSYWPQNFSWVNEPIMKCFSGISLSVEIVYGITLWHIRKQERYQTIEKSK